MAERGVEVDHATLNRWVVRFSPTIAANLAGLQSLNVILKFTRTGRIINIVQSKYLNPCTAG